MTLSKRRQDFDPGIDAFVRGKPCDGQQPGPLTQAVAGPDVTAIEAGNKAIGIGDVPRGSGARVGAGAW